MWKHLFVVTALSVAPASIARADVPPVDGDDVETCTVENESANGRECRACNTYYGNPADHCERQAGPGFSRSCRGGGASVWTEVWCRAGTAAPTPAPAPAPAPEPAPAPAPQAGTDDPSSTGAATDRPARIREGCHATSPAGAGFAWLALGAAFVATRRARRGRTR